MPAGYQWEYARATLKYHSNNGYTLRSVSANLSIVNYPSDLQLDTVLMTLGNDAWDITTTLHDGQDIILVLKRPR